MLNAQAFASLNASPGARALYDELRARGIEHNDALRRLANRLVGMVRPRPGPRKRGLRGGARGTDGVADGDEQPAPPLDRVMLTIRALPAARGRCTRRVLSLARSGPMTGTGLTLAGTPGMAMGVYQLRVGSRFS